MLLKILLRILITAGALLLIAKYVPGIEVTSFGAAVIAALVLGIINVTLKPVILILTLPLTIITFGLFAFIVNIFLFWFASTFVQGFAIAGIIPAIIGALIVSVVSWLTHRLF